MSSCGNGENQSDSNQEPRQQETAAQFTDQDLRNAALQGQLSDVRQMVEQGVDVNASGEGGRTPLMLASFNGHTDIVQLLLEEGARIDDRNADGRTPLIFAASGPFPNTVALLLEQGADPDATDGVDGWSALMFAAAEGNANVVQVLLEQGADPSLTDKDEETALDFARNNNHTEVVELLKTYE
ncbi:Ankyrin repeat [Fodinibius roseus]|uniref:Ankyrin repeat n=1 Tax=Fodinibius roseus TaxID=1194090 RepID=A0A1M5C454_9BACT|nr:ankyrin repeat domain-containing protein [Fodinibius roseus]SHF49481.1 Ankyrin repeat [Fodinibius roseus]